MYSVTFELETITPMFMYGAEQNKAELRPPSFKGMMRFWWRAMRAEDSIADFADLAQEESLLFGGTGEKQGRSKVIVKIVQREDKNPAVLQKKHFQEEFQGVSYLLYSTFMKPKQCFSPNTKFKLELSSNDKNALQQAEAAFWLALTFGGFGTRARRGGGNVAVKTIACKNLSLEYEEELSQRYILQTDLQAYLRQGYQKAKSVITQNQAGTEEYSNLSKARIWINTNIQDQTSWKKVLDNLGRAFMDYRGKTRRHPDYQKMVDFLLEHENKTSLERVNFGLPIVGRFNHNKDVKGRKYSITPVLHGEAIRRASPLIIKILKHGQNLIPMVLLLSGQFLPKEATLELKETGRGRPREQQKFHQSNIIEDFLRVLTQEHFFQEVTL